MPIIVTIIIIIMVEHSQIGNGIISSVQSLSTYSS